MGFLAADFSGTYFAATNFTISNATYDPATGAVAFTVTATKGTGINSPASITLNQAGTWG